MSIVGEAVVVATSHVLFRSDGVDAQASAVLDGMKHLAKRVKQAQPHRVFIASSQHGVTLPPSGVQPPFVVGTGSTMASLGELEIPAASFRGDPDVASQFCRYAGDRGFDIATSDTLVADHGVVVPLVMLLADLTLPVTQLVVNSDRPEVTASPARTLSLGKVLGQFIRETQPGTTLVIGAGGLSHWPGGPRMGEINEAFDRRFLSLLEQGDLQTPASWTNDYINGEAGNGGLEIRNWLLAAAASRTGRGSTVYYEPIEPWITGMAGMEFF